MAGYQSAVRRDVQDGAIVSQALVQLAAWSTKVAELDSSEDNCVFEGGKDSCV